LFFLFPFNRSSSPPYFCYLSGLNRSFFFFLSSLHCRALPFSFPAIPFFFGQDNLPFSPTLPRSPSTLSELVCLCGTVNIRRTPFSRCCKLSSPVLFRFGKRFFALPGGISLGPSFVSQQVEPITPSYASAILAVPSTRARVDSPQRLESHTFSPFPDTLFFSITFPMFKTLAYR